MKKYKMDSAAWRRQKETQMYQRIAAEKPKPERRTDGQKYLHPERHRRIRNVDDLTRDFLMNSDRIIYPKK